ncbi:hypothetical protein P5673_013315 [Acropora cervicornis]|uniref:Uncharacterized protein n=1 Tax=Acropora cervicornis TaxID=6130 RepID=A0AAD9QMB8_ACRCE|nr:hypothetical protein P5673_013315 [Acropora cervicornis]
MQQRSTIKILVCLGVLFFVSCRGQSAQHSCAECQCCYDLAEICLDQCEDPSECTDCSEYRENCEEDLGCRKRKRVFQNPIKMKADHRTNGFISDKKGFASNDKRCNNSLSCIFTKRRNNRQYQHALKQEKSI